MCSRHCSIRLFHYVYWILYFWNVLAITIELLQLIKLLSIFEMSFERQRVFSFSIGLVG